MFWGGVINYRVARVPLPKSMFSTSDQYFAKDIIQIDNEEVFVDCGAYIGDTIQQFIDIAKRKRKKFKKIIAFEPDVQNMKLLKKFFGKRRNIILIPKGLSDKAKILFFKEDNSGRGAISKIVKDEKEATTKISVVNMDTVTECEDATWIKMDIEGAEWEALHGAENIIRRNHPKLTICIYHSNEDILRIAEYVHELVPQYRLYIRHHSRGANETVLYAVI